MKLLSKSAADSKLKRDNDSLVEINIRLRKYEKEITTRLNNIRDTYEPEKLQRLKEYEAYCKDILEKKAQLLEEFTGIQELIKQKKEQYYSLIEKEDALLEKAYLIEEGNKKLRLRELFVTDLEAKWREHENVHNEA